jgi:Replication-relaxation
MGPLLPLRDDSESGFMRLMPRDQKVLVKLAAARWLTTSQVAGLCFPAVSIEMARRRLRLLRGARYIRSLRGSQMAESLHTLGVKGKELLIGKGWQKAIPVERRPPRNLEHFLGINAIRVAVERSARRDDIALGFFFASWELQQQGWPHAVIPDAACHLARRAKTATVLFEYDRGEESAEYVARVKFRRYVHGLDGFPFSQVLVVGDSGRRLQELGKRASRFGRPGLFEFRLLSELMGSWSVAQLLS